MRSMTQRDSICSDLRCLEVDGVCDDLEVSIRIPAVVWRCVCSGLMNEVCTDHEYGEKYRYICGRYSEASANARVPA